ncbi:hypothetical protein ACP70R_008197 [Stipagrostis hirtigluma subsp. patula]
MADLAVGLSRTAVEALVNKFKSAIKEEEEQWQTVQRDMVFIIDEFEMMQSFLSSADGERIKNIVVRTWVRQVRDLSYDVEDCIEFVLHLDTTKRSWWLRLLPTCGKEGAVLPVDEAVSEIKLLKARVEDVSQRNMRYNLISDSGSRPLVEVQQEAAAKSRSLDILIDAAKMRRGHLSDLVQLITRDDNNLQVISVCGTGGDHGKMSIIKNAYDDSIVRENFRCRAWVKLMHPFNPHEFIRGLLAQFYTNSCQEHGGAVMGLDVLTRIEVTQGDLVSEFVEQVNNQRYLIILEDLFSVVQWVAIRSYLPDTKNGSRIIVSTNQLEIARLCMEKPYGVLELSQLSADHSVFVFFKELSQRDEASDWGVSSAKRKAIRHWVVNVLRVGLNPEADIEVLDKQITSRRDGDKPHVVSVLGTPSVGASALVRTVYCRHVLLQKFHTYAWVNVSHPLDFSNFCMRLLWLLGEAEGLQRTIISGSNPTEECRELLHKQRCLVIIDDLQRKEDWDKINAELISETSLSCIVVITKEEGIAKHCAVDNTVCKVDGLEADAVCHLMNEMGFRQGDARGLHWVDNVRLFGRDLEAKELFNMVTDASNLSVWGLPGVGKSALFRTVYYRHMVINDFAKYAWVNVSHPFNLMDFCQQLLSDLHVELGPCEINPSQIEDPIQKCRRLLNDHRCLVVIDGLQSEEDWDSINAKLISGSSRSCVVVITTEENVATHSVVTEGAIYSVKALDHRASLCLLIDKVFENTEVNLDYKMFLEARNMLFKCGGLPKVIVSLAGYLATRPRDMQEQRMRSLNANFMNVLETSPELYCLRSLLTWMHSYLDACPSHLKKCMLYMSIFPPGVIIRRGRLVRRWIAEGYSKGKDSSSLVKYAENLYDQLATLSVMHPAPKTSEVAGYQVNGFFREYLISRPMEEKVFFPLEVSALEEGHGGLSTEGIGQHLAVGPNWVEDQIVFESLDFSRLRSLSVFQIFLAFYVSDKMRVLRVLDLENAHSVIGEDFEVIGKLPRLKFLSIRGQKRVSRLPDSLGGLMQLQTLDIRDTSIVRLPASITKLRKLQCIRAGTTVPWTGDEAPAAEAQSSSRTHTLISCLPKFLRRGPVGSRINGGVELPRGIKHLNALHTLGAVNVNTADGDAILDEIGSLQQLKKLHVVGINRRNSRLLYRAIPYGLESLSLQFGKENNVVNWSDILLLIYLRSLKLYGHVENKLLADEEFSYLLVLTKLSLEMTTLFTSEDIGVLGRLAALHTLRLRVKKDQDGELQFPSAHFSKLQNLEIACKSRLHVKFDEGAMEKLELLKVHCLDGSAMKFSGLEHPASLKQVWVQGSFDDALREALKQQLAIHPKQPILMLNNEIAASSVREVFVS